MQKILKNTIETAVGEPISDNFFHTGRIQTVSGKSFFLKSGASSPAFQCEANSLNELTKADAIAVVKVIAVGENFILTEYINSNAPMTAGFFPLFGKQLAQMHRCQSPYIGFYENNFIGATPQLNLADAHERQNWPAFYFNKRLLFQYKLAERNNLLSKRLRNAFAKLETKIEPLLEGSCEPPALLHGDLWSGNYLSNTQGHPVLIDPAVYYGHREADLAMTRLFGGFPAAFYEAYMQEYPLPTGWERRDNLYRLYHVLNHLNLFGNGYLSEAEYITEEL